MSKVKGVGFATFHGTRRLYYWLSNKIQLLSKWFRFSLSRWKIFCKPSHWNTYFRTKKRSADEKIACGTDSEYKNTPEDSIYPRRLSYKNAKSTPKFIIIFYQSQIAFQHYGRNRKRNRRFIVKKRYK